MKTMQRIERTALAVAVAALFTASPAMAGKNKDPWTQITFSGTFVLVPPADSPEPAASGTASETDGVSAIDTSGLQPSYCGWSFNSVTCRHLTPAKQYQITCLVHIRGYPRNWGERWELQTYTYTADGHGRLNADFDIDGGSSWPVLYFGSQVQVSSMEIQDDAGNVVLVRVAK